MPYGAFVEFLPGKEGLLHISEVSNKRLESMEGIMNVGDVIKVKLLDVDKKTGKFKLSSKVLMEKQSQN
jgi:polyribonucleotide nucleotidyltransferase